MITFTAVIHTSDLFSNRKKYYWDALILLILLFIIKIRIFRGDLIDFSAETETLIHMTITHENFECTPLHKI